MFAHRRLEKIFLQLYENDFVKQENLVVHFTVSARTIRTDIKEINTTLEPFAATVRHIRGSGYWLSEKSSLKELYSKAKQSEDGRLESLTERVNSLLWSLLTSVDYISAESFCEMLFISKTTLSAYLRRVRKKIAVYNLRIASKANWGYRLEGEEQAVRECIFYEFLYESSGLFVEYYHSNVERLLAGIDLVSLRKEIVHAFSPRNFAISDSHYKNHVLWWAVAVIRGRLAREIRVEMQQSNQVVIAKTEELSVRVGEQYNIALSRGDKAWLVSKFMIGLGMPARHRDKNDDGAKRGVEIENGKQIADILAALLEQVYTHYNIDLSNDQLLREDITEYFEWYFFNRKDAELLVNPLLGMIVEKYRDTFNLINQAMTDISLPGMGLLSEHHLANLTIFLASSLACYANANQRIKKVVIACGDGTLVARLIEMQLCQAFPNQLEIVASISLALLQESKKMEADFVVSTNPLPKQDVPIIQFHFDEVEKTFVQIRRYLNAALNS